MEIKSNIKEKLLKVVKRKGKIIEKNIEKQMNYIKNNKEISKLYKEHVNSYTDEMNYKQINGYMYGKDIDLYLDDYVIPNINGILKVFNKIPKITDDITVFRISDYRINGKTLKDKNEIFIPAFISTSYDIKYLKDIKENQNMIDILVPKGSSGILASLSKFYEKEKELILPPGYYDIINETERVLKNGVKVYYYKLKVREQILTPEDWVKHLKINKKDKEIDTEYFLNDIKILNSKKLENNIKLNKEKIENKEDNMKKIEKKPYKKVKKIVKVKKPIIIRK